MAEKPYLFRSGIPRLVSPGPLQGLTLDRWVKLLKTVRFRIGKAYFPKVFTLTGISLINFALSRWENRLFYSRYRETEVPPPVLILGLPRSGTTFLHNLLARDHRFAFANLYQVRHPATFLLTEKWVTSATEWLVSGKRAQDNVNVSWNSPQEDEFGVMELCLKSAVFSMLFPAFRPFFERYLSFESCSETEQDQWKEAFYLFLQKLTFKYQKTLILKSPTHMGKIYMVRELFPSAKFIHIVRNPYDVYRSVRSASAKIRRLWRFHDHSVPDPLSVWINSIKILHDSFYRHGVQIPPGHLYALRFEDLEKDPVGVLEKLYEFLDLPDFGAVKQKIADYAGSLSGYKKNLHAPLSPREKKKIADACALQFERGGYPR